MHHLKKPTPTLHVVEEYPGSFEFVEPEGEQPPVIGGIVRSVTGDVPEGVVGAFVMLHLPSCGLRYGQPRCDCAEFDDEDEPTGRRLTPPAHQHSLLYPHPHHPRRSDG